MDEVARYNRERWNELAKANVVFSRPYLDLSPQSARQVVDPQGMLGDTNGIDVLCLGGGGGQQSAALALLGARVTVLDLSDAQLERDREAATHYGVGMITVQGDMRDLSPFGAEAFDVVYQPYSINFVPEVGPVFAEVARVLRKGGLYYLQWHNPFAQPLDERDWDGRGYALRVPYTEGELELDDPHWDIDAGDGGTVRIVGPREFRHKLSTVANGLISLGFSVLGLWESTDSNADADAEPGTWEHFQAVAPPYLTLWAALRPGIS
jgi:SAM-dependent methyltransferase